MFKQIIDIADFPNNASGNRQIKEFLANQNPDHEISREYPNNYSIRVIIFSN